MSESKMRDAFESWAEANLGLSIRRNPSGAYQSFGVYSAWEAWQASLTTKGALDKKYFTEGIEALNTYVEAEKESQIFRAENLVRESGRASISALQRYFKINYDNACRLMEQLVLRDVVSPADSEGRRTVLSVKVSQ
jgi:DNA segregation ATPase FtsK/SpoIIIE-like protein